jgi:hypothetical protein
MSSSDFEIIITWKISPIGQLWRVFSFSTSIGSPTMQHWYLAARTISDVNDPRVGYPIKDNNYGIQIV